MIRIIAVGRNNPLLKSYEAEFLKVIGKFSKVEIIEIKEDKSDSVGQIISREGEKILSKIGSGEFLCTLEIEGKQMDSIAFSEVLRKNRDITFVIGGAFGLSEEVSKRADMKLSFSPMTFNHQLMRVVLLEQVFRGLSIINGHGYHK